MKINDKFELIKIPSGANKYCKIGEVFKISDIDEESYIFILKNYNTGFAFGMTKEEIKNYFEPYKSDIEKDIEKLNGRIIINNKVTIVILENNIKGKSKCMDEDEYDRDKGIKIAYNRALIKKLNKELKQLTK